MQKCIFFQTFFYFIQIFFLNSQKTIHDLVSVCDVGGQDDKVFVLSFSNVSDSRDFRKSDPSKKKQEDGKIRRVRSVGGVSRSGRRINEIKKLIISRKKIFEIFA